jgi:hypothetical protein
LISRAEIRWDHNMGGDDSYGKAPPDERDAFTLALNLIYKF